MDTRKVATEYRMVQWAQTLQARQSSGQSIKEFCEAAQISRNTYFYWQRKLREAACTELSRQSPLQCQGDIPVPSGWAQLAAREGPSANAGIIIEIGGFRVEATHESDLELLARVCRLLKVL